MRKRILFIIAAVTLVAGITVMLLAQPQTMPVLNQGTHGDQTVSGRVAPDSGPLKIFDISYSTRTSIGHGKTSIDSAGNFAVSVKPPLVGGHKIIVEDNHGHTSAPMTVRGAGPAAGPSQ